MKLFIITVAIFVLNGCSKNQPSLMIYEKNINGNQVASQNTNKLTNEKIVWDGREEYINKNIYNNIIKKYIRKTYSKEISLWNKQEKQEKLKKEIELATTTINQTMFLNKHSIPTNSFSWKSASKSLLIKSFSNENASTIYNKRRYWSSSKRGRFDAINVGFGKKMFSNKLELISYASDLSFDYAVRCARKTMDRK